MIAMVSGGFDPLHIGHVRLIKAAHSHGNVVVALNSNEWLMRKKNYIFMTFAERSEILSALKNVLYVVPVVDDDETICSALYHVKPDFFCNGGDRTKGDLREHETCEKLRIKEIFNVGGDKVQSSRNLVRGIV